MSTAPTTPTPLSPHAEIAHRIVSNLVQASAPALSPDGSRVAFVVTRVDDTANRYRSQVWLAATDGSDDPHPVTGGEYDSSPAWSPCGRYLAFAARRHPTKGESTLHVLPVDAPGETRVVASMKESIGEPQYSPDGRWIAFSCRTRDARYDAQGSDDGDTSWQPPRRIDRFFTQLNGEGWVFDRPQHLYVVRADGTAAPRNLTPGPFQHGHHAWTPSSDALVTSAACHDTWDLDLAVDLQLVRLDGTITALTHQTGNYMAPSVSADGTQVAFLGHDDSRTYPQNVKVGVLPIDGGAHRWVSSTLDRTFEATSGTHAPVWLDAHTLVGSAEDRGQTHLWRVATDGAAPVALTSGPLTVKSFDAAGGTTVYCAGAVDELSDVFVLTDGEPRRLTRFAADFAALASPLRWERFAVPCTDGSDEIDAWIMRPADFDPSRTYPLVLNVHGGPHTQYGETYFDEAQFQAAAGFVVLMCNPRGGSGRHEGWGQSIMGPHHPVRPGAGWGSVDVDDVMAVLDHTLANHPYVDPKRVGMQGGSYGGYMATLLAGRFSDRFAAICSERAVNNLLTEEFTSDISTMFTVEHGPTHLDDPEEYLRLSPIRFVRDIDCPLLIIHSEQDLRCPISQAEELFVAMRLLGKDVTFYRFPGESHELSRSGSPVHRVQRAEIILDFFADKLA